ncbi:MAG TPA: phosphoribosylglycinamide formyltransferase [Chloroflexota bacterium]|jgi:phosphoribosylglycinamide formyltransferase-1|nr:phosphoribosylglycinamide formyltransferase [Chloroflexota bacterium]
MSPSPLPLGVLVSGRGTNLMAIHAAIARGELAARVVLVASNRPEAPAIAWARAQGLPVALFPRRDYASRAAAQAALARALQAAGAELVVLAGWDQVLTPEFVATFTGRLMNIHPSLLPAFAGTMHAVEEALAWGVKVSGCTVHYVTAEVDAGPIILQAAVPVYDDDTPATLLARIHEQEHHLLPQAIALHAAGRLRVEGRRVRILPP